MGINYFPSTTLSELTDSPKRAYVIADNKLALNCGLNRDLLHEELFRPKTTEFETYPLRFDLKENADITVDREIDHPE